MGWKSALLGVGQIVGGAVLTGASFGAAAPLGGALIASGLGTIAGGVGADAVKKAAETQTAAGTQALGVNQQIYRDTSGLQQRLYNQSRSDFAPYLEAGAGGLGNMRELVGLPPSSGQTPLADALPPAMPPTAPTDTPGAVRRPTTDPHTAAAVASQSAYRPRSSTLGSVSQGMVTLRGPDGSVRSLPAQHPQIRQLVAAGAEVVS